MDRDITNIARALGFPDPEEAEEDDINDAATKLLEAARWAYALSTSVEGSTPVTLGGRTLGVMHLRVIFASAFAHTTAEFYRT